MTQQVLVGFDITFFWSVRLTKYCDLPAMTKIQLMNILICLLLMRNISIGVISSGRRTKIKIMTIIAHFVVCFMVKQLTLPISYQFLQVCLIMNTRIIYLHEIRVSVTYFFHKQIWGEDRWLHVRPTINVQCGLANKTFSCLSFKTVTAIIIRSLNVAWEQNSEE